MSKTVTLRLDDETYNKFSIIAKSDNRSISNLIQNLALIKLQEDSIIDNFEMDEIFSNKKLVSSLKKGSIEAKERKGRFID